MQGNMPRRQLYLEKVFQELFIDPGSDEEPHLDDDDKLLNIDDGRDGGLDDGDEQDEDGAGDGDGEQSDDGECRNGESDGDGSGSEGRDEVFSDRSHVAATENLDPHDDGSKK